jgi:hypothetical protein
MQPSARTWSSRRWGVGMPDHLRAWLRLNFGWDDLDWHPDDIQA